MPSDQETVNKVGEHLALQNAKSVDLKGTSMLRNPDGLKCAIGCLIPDSMYKPELENQNIYEYDHRGAKVLSKLGSLMQSMGYDPELLQALQKIHDDLYEGWRLHFSRLCFKRNLKNSISRKRNVQQARDVR